MKSLKKSMKGSGGWHFWGPVLLAALIPASFPYFFWEEVKNVLIFLKEGLLSILNISVPIYLILLVILAIILVIWFCAYRFGAVTERQDADHHNYTEDVIRDVVWRWRWSKNTIINLVCYCPACDTQLEFWESSRSRDEVELRCGGKCEPDIRDYVGNTKRIPLKSTIRGRSSRDALNKIESEILRRIRTEEYKAGNKG